MSFCLPEYLGYFKSIWRVWGIVGTCSAGGILDFYIKPNRNPIAQCLVILWHVWYQKHLLKLGNSMLVSDKSWVLNLDIVTQLGPKSCKYQPSLSTPGSPLKFGLKHSNLTLLWIPAWTVTIPDNKYNFHFCTPVNFDFQNFHCTHTLYIGVNCTSNKSNTIEHIQPTHLKQPKPKPNPTTQPNPPNPPNLTHLDWPTQPT